MASVPYNTEAVKKLTQQQLENDTPGCRAPFVAVINKHIDDINFADRAYFDAEQYLDARGVEKPAAAKYFQKEALYLQKLTELLKEGKQLVNTLYAFRSSGRAIPQVQSHNQENKEVLYRRTYDVLRPEIARMTQLMTFRDKIIPTFTEVLTSIIPDVKDRDVFPSEPFLIAFCQILDLVICIDTMKNMKGSMNNDLSMYKRAMSFFPKEQSELEMMVLPKLALFLATQDQFILEIRKALSTINSTYEEIIQDMLNLCADYLETSLHMTPAAKHSMLRGMALGVALIDGEGDDRDFSKKKKLKLEKIGRILKLNPIVPLFGDIAINLASIYAKAPHLSSAKWDQYTVEDTRAVYSLTKSVNAVHTKYTEYLSRAKPLIQKAKRRKARYGDLPIEESTELYQCAFDGVGLLSLMTTCVIEQAAWKYVNPTSIATNPHIPENATSYELAVRYNYSLEDRRVLVEFIAMIKNLSSLLYEVDGDLQDALDKAMYCATQGFMKNIVSDYYGSALKKKKAVAPLLKYLRDSMTDGKVDDDALSKGGTAMNSGKPRISPLSFSQIYFGRSMLDFSFNEKSKGMKGGLMKEKNFKESQVVELQKFFEASFFFPYMTNWRQTIRECSDLSNLWFKEFYLELSKQIQFPISTSLPWILTEFVLESNRADILQLVYYPLDLYNDAATRTLYDLKSQVIYDEIEAEVNLCFDQFMFKLGQRVFSHYKKTAAMLLLSPDMHVDGDSTSSTVAQQDGLNSSSFEPIMKQNEFKLLGRNIDCTNILAQMARQYLRINIDVAISRYECSDLTYLVELQNLLNCARLTHELLSQTLPLNSFDELLKEVDQSVSLVSLRGRILKHTVDELINDFIPNFCFNSVTNRFIRSPVFYTEPIIRGHIAKARLMHTYGTKSLAVAFTIRNGMYKDFIGEPHFQALIQLVGEETLSIIIKEVTRHVELIVEHTMTPYMDVVLACVHKNINNVAPPNFSVNETYDFYTSQLKQLIGYSNLKSEIFQTFREIGNAILTIKMIEDCWSVERTMSKNHTEDVISIDNTKTTLLSGASKLDDLLQTTHYPMSYQTWESKLSEFMKPKLLRIPLLYPLLEDLEAAFLQLQVKNTSSQQSLDYFYSIWSALLFSACVPSVSGERSIRELFGDGLLWAGCSILHVLGQRDLYEGNNTNQILIDRAVNDANRAHRSQDASVFVQVAWLLSTFSSRIFDSLQAVEGQF